MKETVLTHFNGQPQVVLIGQAGHIVGLQVFRYPPGQKLPPKDDGSVMIWGRWVQTGGDDQVTFEVTWIEMPVLEDLLSCALQIIRNESVIIWQAIQEVKGEEGAGFDEL